MTKLSEDSSDGGNSFTMGVCLDTLSDGGVRFFQSFQFDPLCKTVTKVKPRFLTKTLQQRKNFDGASLTLFFTLFHIFNLAIFATPFRC